MTDPSRHADSRGMLESLLRKIPGFKGYLEREYRRESDQLARNLIVDELQRAKSRLDRFQRALVDSGNLDAMGPCDRLRTQLDLVQSRVKGAMKGYSPFFGFVTVDEGVLDQVYQLDLATVNAAHDLAEQTEQLPAGAEGLAALTAITAKLDELGRQIDQRTKILTGLN